MHQSGQDPKICMPLFSNKPSDAERIKIVNCSTCINIYITYLYVHIYALRLGTETKDLLRT